MCVKFYFSVINKIEHLGFSGITEPEESKFQELIFAATVLNLDQDVVKSTIEIRKNYRITIPDAIIDATALAQGLTLISRNIKDFKNIRALELLNPLEI